MVNVGNDSAGCPCCSTSSSVFFFLLFCMLMTFTLLRFKEKYAFFYFTKSRKVLFGVNHVKPISIMVQVPVSQYINLVMVILEFVDLEETCWLALMAWFYTGLHAQHSRCTSYALWACGSAIFRSKHSSATKIKWLFF